ncbi:MAG: hypothetical protein Kow00129_15480 [Thermoleophilia bacterium]
MIGPQFKRNSNGSGKSESSELKLAETPRSLEETLAELPDQARWEYMSVIVWDDDSKSSVTSDLEDVEVLNDLGLEGWELVCVVPLARTQVLEMAYPGNTRKLLAYFKRPVL